jgi:AcrR family transcriptional regulator
MPVTCKTKREVVSEFRCGEILEAARKVFAKRGFNQTTVDGIASAAGIAKGTIYLYFHSKREIYLEALKRDILALHAETNSRVAASRTIDEKIRAFISTRVRYLEENRDFFKIYYSEFANFFIPLAATPKGFRELYLQQAKMLESVLREAVREGIIRKVCPHTTALRIYDMTLGLAAQRLLGWSKANVEEDLELLFDLLWKGIGTQNESSK